jgi:ribonucleoside-diphosphate reductase beta chain
MLTNAREGFITNTRKLNYASFPMRLWQKAKKLGIWNPSDIDFTQDAKDWVALNDLEREVLLNLAAMYQAGEESVTLDLLPLIMVIANQGQLEEEMFLTSFLWEEAKHLETFGRFMTEVAHADGDLSRFHTPSYHTIFYQELHTSLELLKTDSSPVALARASVTYNMIVEGVLAETGYHAYYNILECNKIMPGMQFAMQKFKQDESRHIAYGVYLLSRLVAEHGNTVWGAIEARMGELFVPAIGVVNELFDITAARGEIPFNLEQDEFVNFAIGQFQKRIARIERARGLSLAQVLGEESLQLELEEVVA